MRASFRVLLAATSLLACLPATALPQGQTAPAQAGTATTGSTVRLLGTVTTLNTDSLVLKLEAGGEATVQFGAQTKMVRTAPGATTLKGATPINAADLATGDRVLVRALPGPDANHYTANAIIAMKQADIAQAHASEVEDWQRRGVGGVVSKLDPDPSTAAAGAPPPPLTAVTISGARPGQSTIVYVTPATTIRRYADDSVNFADAKPAAITNIHPGDQLRARGDKSESAGMERVTAVEVVAGSFRNIAGTITSVDPGRNTLTVTDLATKKPVTLRLTAETQLRKLPPQMAQRLAGKTGSGEGAGSPGASPMGRPAGGGTGTSGQSAGAPNAEAEARPRGGDAATMLQHAPTVTLAELNKGDAIMVVAARSGGGAADAATVITLIAGVEPLLQSNSGASQNLFSASWNLSGGGEAAP